jgi:hypothetical protein
VLAAAKGHAALRPDTPDWHFRYSRGGQDQTGDPNANGPRSIDGYALIAANPADATCAINSRNVYLVVTCDTAEDNRPQLICRDRIVLDCKRSSHRESRRARSCVFDASLPHAGAGHRRRRGMVRVGADRGPGTGGGWSRGGTLKWSCRRPATSRRSENQPSENQPKRHNGAE